MFPIRIYNSIATAGLSHLDEHYFTFSDEQPAGILLRSQDLHKETIPDSVLAIARAGAGTNNIPISTCSERGIVVFNTPGANANAVKELVIAAMIMSARHLLPACNWAKALTGEDIAQQVEKGKKQFVGTELRGKTIGVIGLGAIGHRIAQNTADLGMKVKGYDPYMKRKPIWLSAMHIELVDDLKSLAETCDYITLHVPYNASNHHLINADFLSICKPELILLNFSRGELVDTEALIHALDEKRIAGYSTDFANPMLLNRDDVLAFPHLGASTTEAEENCAIMASDSMRDFLLYGNIHNSVNFPDVSLELTSPYRLCIVNRNIANMVALISNALGARGINIDSIQNRSRGEYAYTLVDIEEAEKAVLDEIKRGLESQEGIIRTRLIRNESC